MATLGGFLIGVGLCFLLIAPTLWYVAWSQYSSYFYALVQGQGGKVYSIRMSPFDISNMVMPIFFGCVVSIIGTYTLVRERKKASIKGEKSLVEKPLPYGNAMLALWGGFVAIIIAILLGPLNILWILFGTLGIVIIGATIRNLIKINRMNVEIKKRKALPTSTIETLPTSKQSKISNQYYCKACGHLFWRAEYPEIEVSQCQKCKATDLIRVAKLEYIEAPPPETIRIRIVEKEKQASTTFHTPSEQIKYRSQFHCNACGRSFWVYEHRLKIPYCCECGAPDPVFIATNEV